MSATDPSNRTLRYDDWEEGSAPLEERLRDLLLQRSRGGIATGRLSDWADLLGVRPKQARAALYRLITRGSVVCVRRPGGADLYYLTAATIVCPCCTR